MSVYGQKFYAHGETFETFEKMSNYCKIWPDMPCDLYEFKKQMDIRVNEIEMNMQLRSYELTNRAAYLMLRLVTDWAVKRPPQDTPDGKGET